MSGSVEAALRCHENVASERRFRLVQDAPVRVDDDVASVQDDVGGDAIQAELCTGSLVVRDVLRIAFQVIRAVPVLQKQVLLQLERHVISRPDVLAYLRPRQPTEINTFGIERSDDLLFERMILGQPLS